MSHSAQSNPPDLRTHRCVSTVLAAGKGSNITRPSSLRVLSYRGRTRRCNRYRGEVAGGDRGGGQRR